MRRWIRHWIRMQIRDLLRLISDLHLVQISSVAARICLHSKQPHLEQPHITNHHKVYIASWQCRSSLHALGFVSIGHAWVPQIQVTQNASKYIKVPIWTNSFTNWSKFTWKCATFAAQVTFPSRNNDYKNEKYTSKERTAHCKNHHHHHLRWNGSLAI